MGNHIKLLPDSIANQIAAGEVIQRPASVVKELLENAVDAEATEINLIIKEAGKTLIQVIDNGKGMNESDARLSLERHATSKISQTNDLFDIKTMGFRGEALASIASISHLEIKTKSRDEDLGTRIIVEGSTVKKQEPCQTKNGSSFAVKNLFYNVPARRKFLKSERAELRHIIDEFERVALPNPHIKFTFTHNGNDLFQLESTVLRGRIIDIFGKRYKDSLAPVKQETDIVNLRGFIVKPEKAKKTRGDQFFFVNGRFIKSAYLHHGVKEAMSELLPKDSHPGYFIEFQVNPGFIDVNIHPTKTEIKFEDDRAVYAILKSSVRQTIGQYNLTPGLDFEREQGFDAVPSRNDQPVKAPEIKVNPDFNPFHKSSGFSSYNQKDRERRENYQKMFETTNPEHHPNHFGELPQSDVGSDQKMNFEPESQNRHTQFYPLYNKYLLVKTANGEVLIHKSRAHERILFERFSTMLEKEGAPSQQSLFPQQVNFNQADADLIQELQPGLKKLGFEISPFGNTGFIVQGMPEYAAQQDPAELLEGVIENFKNNRNELKLNKQEAFARSLARKTAIGTGKKLSDEETQVLLDELFSCENPNTTPTGLPIIKPLGPAFFDDILQ